MDNNNILWNNTSIINWYKNRSHIQNGENKIIELVDFTKISSLLDIGVGGGRTTQYFSPLVERYKGIDISPKFINVCKKKYDSLDFECMDVLNIKNLQEKFDFVLFSHNGIDNILNFDDYKNVLKNMFNLCNKNGYVCFSSHNSWYYNLTADYTKLKKCVVNAMMYQIYINPLFLHKFLDSYSSDIKIIDRNGKEVDIFNNKSRSCWLYYLCKKTKDS